MYCKNSGNADRSNPERIVVVNKKLEALKENINSSNLDTFLISSEDFPGEKPEEIKYIHDLLLNVCDVKIIVYLRRQDEFIWSWFSQVLKTIHINQSLQYYLPLDHTMSDCISQLYNAENILNYEKFLDPWAMVFGTENILVNVFPPDENLIVNFFKNLDIELNFLKFVLYIGVHQLI